MIEPKFISVTKEEFEHFLETYPRPLDRDVYAVCDPPAITYNDFELATEWPESIVARTWMYSDDEKDIMWYEPPEDRRWYILENYEEIYRERNKDATD